LKRGGFVGTAVGTRTNRIVSNGTPPDRGIGLVSVGFMLRLGKGLSADVGKIEAKEAMTTIVASRATQIRYCTLF